VLVKQKEEKDKEIGTLKKQIDELQQKSLAV
jgi:hypothetical protein